VEWRHHLYRDRRGLAVPSWGHRPVQSPGGGLELAAAHAGEPGQGRAGHGVVAAAPAAWSDIPQRPRQPVLQRRVPERFERLEDALIDEQERQLLGQRADRELLGPTENGQRAWAQVRHQRAGQAGCDGLDGFLQSPQAAFVAGYLSPMQFEQRWYEAQYKKAA